MSFKDAADAITRGDLEAVEALVGADSSLPLEEDKYDEVMESVDSPAGMAMAPVIGTLLHIASKYGRVQAAKTLLDGGSEVNHMETVHWHEAPADHRTPLYLAVWSGNLDMVKLLVESGAQVNLVCGPCGAPKRPLEEAAYNGFTDIARTLLEAKAEVEGKELNLLMARAIQGQNAETLELLIQRKAAVNRGPDEGEAPLHMAARLSCPDIAKLLIAHGAVPSADEGDALLSIASSAKAQWEEFVSMAPSGPERDWREQNQEKHMELVKVLLETGTLKAAPGSLDHVRKLFKKFDINGDGAIQKDELYTVLKALDDSGTWTEERMENLMLAADLNKDGRIAFEEFLKWVFGTESDAVAIRDLKDS